MCRWLAYSGSPVAARGPALQAEELPGRAEQALPDGGDHDQRRRLRRRLVRRGRDPRGLPQHRAGVERPQPARAVRARPGRAGSSPTSGPPPGRPCSRPTATRSATRTGCGCTTATSRDFREVKRDLAMEVDPDAVRRHRGLHRLRDALLPGAELRAARGPAGRRGARGRARRGGRPQHGVDFPGADDRGDHRRHQIWAFRYSSEGLSRSLFQSTDVSTLRAQYPDNPMLHGVSDDARLVVSEPLGDLEGAWREIPEASCGVIREGQDECARSRPSAGNPPRGRGPSAGLAQASLISQRTVPVGDGGARPRPSGR